MKVTTTENTSTTSSLGSAISKKTTVKDQKKISTTSSLGSAISKKTTVKNQKNISIKISSSAMERLLCLEKDFLNRPKPLQNRLLTKESDSNFPESQIGSIIATPPTD